MARAIFNGVVLAESDETISIEGVEYFPPDTVKHEHLEATRTRTACPWRGVATYYTVRVGDREDRDAAFAYTRTKRKARRMEGYVAFWKSVDVEA
ncbi:MAG: DUF427 domain-containing protein [Alphaproteobacteria bacterium]|nr:DUF427 domain-containing protein [Alphaproteobacteria bacterium]